MSLWQLQRAVLELGFGPEPSAADYAALGDARVWAIYRELIRKRLRGELEYALPRTRAAAGDGNFELAFEHFLRSEPPRTRYFHAVVGSFAASAIPWLRASSHVPAHAADLCEYEAALWTVADLAERPDPPAPGEFEFERVPVMSNTLRLLHLRCPVHTEAAGDELDRPGDFYLCVYRRRDAARASHFVLNEMGFALMERFIRGTETVSETIRQLASERDVVVDAAFLDGLCSMLADFLERGIILGGSPLPSRQNRSVF
jgi:hypothetical protein